MTVSMHPSRYRVVASNPENHDTVTLVIRPVDAPVPACGPGQLTMLHEFGAGEVPVPVSGIHSAGGDSLTQTVRGAGTAPARDIRVSLERNMRCGIATCGHCQLGPLLACRDGPVVSYQLASHLSVLKEL
jgi:NAD(P)H-flavin reductase